MRNIKTIFILVLSLILLLAVSCSNEDKTGGETETIEEIDAKDFPTELLGEYRDDILYDMYGPNDCTKVSTITEKGIQKTKIEGTWLLIKDDGTKSGQKHWPSIEKWKKTTKGGKTIKLEGEYYSETNGGKYTIIYDYASETLSCTFASDSGKKYLFNGKKQPTE